MATAGRWPAWCTSPTCNLADVQSPTRFEFLNRYFADPRYAGLVPVQRPQEAITPHAVNAMLRTINGLRGPVTGQPLQLAVTTGDAIDNAQWNEVQAFLALFDGGLVRPDSGGPGYAGVQALDWPDDIFWKPDGDGPRGPDFFRREFSSRALPRTAGGGPAPVLGPGPGCPVAVLLRQPRGAQPGRRGGHPGPRGRPDRGPEAGRAAGSLRQRPGPGAVHRAPRDIHGRPVPHRPGRSRADGRLPAGISSGPTSTRAPAPSVTGSTERNQLYGTAYYSYDTPAVRFIALDTNCLAGGADGCLDRTQARWLEARLAEAHSAYRGPEGQQARTGAEDRLVVLFSHHGVDTLTNTRAGHPGPGGEPLLPAGELVALLHRFRNVVLKPDGHTHTNTIRARRDPADPRRGFWEVTTCAVIDWPCQTRIVELTDRGGQLSILCTMVDHDTPLASRSLRTGTDLAALHRELAANIPFDGPHPGRSGRVSDRNTDLRLPAPFPLSRLPTA